MITIQSGQVRWDRVTTEDATTDSPITVLPALRQSELEYFCRKPSEPARGVLPEKSPNALQHGTLADSHPPLLEAS